jgi:hypothetical protein
MRRQKTLKLVALAGFIAVCANAAIPIVNPSFETPAQANGGYSTAPPTGWTTANGGSAIAVWNPAVSPYPNFYFSVPPPDNKQVIALGGSFSPGEIQQDLGVTLQPNTTYTLGYYVGARLDVPISSYNVQLFAGGAVVIADHLGNPAPGGWVYRSASFHTGPTASGELVIDLLGTGRNYADGVAGQVVLDLIQLTAVPDNATMTVACPTPIAPLGFYSSALVPNGGQGPYTFSITSGSISPLLLNTLSGAITGTLTTASTFPNLTATVTDSAFPQHVATATCPITVTNIATATFLAPPNTAAGGTWKGAFGGDGYMLAGDASSLPAYVSLATIGNTASTFVWAPSSTYTPCLQKAASTTDRICAAWTSATNFTIDVTVDGPAKPVAIYMLDYDAASRTEAIVLVDAVTQTLLDSKVYTGFATGQYLAWNVSGHVQFQVRNFGGPSAVISGILFGAAGPTSPPVITQNPSNASVISGQTATFTVAATGGTLAYQWQSAPSGSSTFTNIGGATNASYTTPALALTDTGTQFRCVVTNSVGPTTSTVATSTVALAHPAITQNPASVSVYVGQTATFTVAASGGNLSYRWQSAPSGSSTFTNIAGATATSYTTPVLALTDNGTQFRCIATNTVASATSMVATLTVLLVAPVITQNPANMSVYSGQTASFTVAATGGGLSYQWQSAPSGSSTFTNIGGATASSYITPVLAVASNGVRFRCVVTNSINSATSSPATLTVTSAIPMITQNPSDVSVFTGNTATFTVAATGPSLTYQWQSAPNGSSTFTNIGGATGTSYTTPVLALASNGTRFHCVVTSYAGPVTSTAAKLTVNLAPFNSAAYAGSDATSHGTWKGAYGADGYVIASDSTSQAGYATATPGGTPYVWLPSTTDPNCLQKGASATDRIASVWYSSTSFTIDANITDGGLHTVSLYALDWDKAGRAERIDVLDYSTLQVLDTRTISNFTTGLYVSWNITGHVTFRVTLLGGSNAVISGIFFGLGQVTMTAPMITQNPTNASVNASQTATFSVVASGGGLGYQWQSQASGASIFTNIAGATSASYTTPATLLTDNGTQFRCVVSNTVSTALTTPVLLTVTLAMPMVTQNPASAFVNVGQTAMFTVVASGGNLSYQWQSQASGGSSFTNIGGATSSTYTTATLGLGNSGTQFRCVVSNSAGTATSTAATLTVTTVPNNGATFVSTDSTTKGTWKGLYGPDGFLIASDSTVQPAYGTATSSGTLFVWDPATQGLPALQKGSATATDRIASTWYSATSFVIDVNLTGGTHPLALYLLDWDQSGRVEQIDVLDAATQKVLDTRVASGFSTGVYYNYSVSGHVQFKITRLTGANSVISGIFFGTGVSNPTISQQPSNVTVNIGQTATVTVAAAGGSLSYQWQIQASGAPQFTNIPGANSSTYTTPILGVSDSGTLFRCVVSNSAGTITSNAATLTVTNIVSSTSAVYVGADTTTKGAWQPTYGANGYAINSYGAQYPLYAQVAFTGTTDYNGGFSIDPSAVQVPAGGLISVWYSIGSQFSIDLNLTDSNTHPISFYFVDWGTASRNQTVTIRDASNNNLLDTKTLSSFVNGRYLTWNITGHVTVTVNLNTGPNPVLSAIFFQ